MCRILSPESPFRHYDLLPNGVILVKPDYTVLYWNTRVAGWTGLSPRDAEGMNLLEKYPSLNSPIVTSRIAQVFEGGPAVLFSPLFHPHLIPCPVPGGKLRVLKISCLPLHHNGENYALFILEDVSDLTDQVLAYRKMKQIAERQLRDLEMAQSALAHVNKKLNLLNSITRHDILNQLTPFQLYLDLAKAEHTDPEFRKVLDNLAHIANGIQEMVEFTKDYQNIGIKAPVWLDAGEVLSRQAGLVPLNGKELVNDISGWEIYADPLFEKVLYNLIENAVRHGEPLKKIRFSAAIRGTDLVITCEDDGVGVPAELKDRIFKREFYKNTGFGLYLSREILGITEISIRENGIPGKGARFEILVPPKMFRSRSMEVRVPARK